jgi:predicted permease
MRFGAHTVEMRDDIAGNVRPVLLVLLAAVGLVLLVACANVASLTLTRADARRREFALRTAVGAGRFHLVRQLIVESLTLATLGAIAGVLLATWAVSALLALQPQAVPLAGEIGLDTPVLLFALAITLLTALLSGLAPLVQQRGDPAAMLRESSRSTAAAPRQRFRRSLVTTELALAVVLLAGAGLLVRSFAGLLAVNPGYAVRNVLTTRISLPDARYPDDPTRRDFFTQLERRAAALPGVLAAGAVSNLPLANGLGDLNIRIEGREVREGEVSPRLDWQVVTPGWFDAMGLTLMMGRAIREDDDERAPGAVVINQSAAQLYFPNQDAIGQRFRLGGGAGPGWVTIVGIVADVRHGRLDDAPTPSMYLPHRQFTFWNGGLAANTMSLVVRTVAEPATLAPTLRNVISQLDPDVPAGAFRTMEEVRDSAVAQPRFVTTLILAFATIALLLAVVGIYGLISFTVGLRRQELGVRVALGAANRQILGLVLKDGLLTVGSGLGIGAVAALVLTRGLAGLLYGVRPGDPATLLAVTLLLAAAALLACLVPARRAARADPMHALRGD